MCSRRWMLPDPTFSRHAISRVSATAPAGASAAGRAPGSRARQTSASRAHHPIVLAVRVQLASRCAGRLAKMTVARTDRGCCRHCDLPPLHRCCSPRCSVDPPVRLSRSRTQLNSELCTTLTPIGAPGPLDQLPFPSECTAATSSGHFRANPAAFARARRPCPAPSGLCGIVAGFINLSPADGRC